MKITDKLPKPFFALAPLDDVSDTVFRQVIAGCAKPDLFFTEFINVDALQSEGRKATLRRLDYDKREKPVIAQIWGKNPENFKKSAQEVSGLGFSGVDLNMGCPIKHVVKNGCCSALINDREKALQIIDATREGTAKNLSFSIKTRIGFSDIDLSWVEFLLKQNLDMLTLHFRTVKEMSKVPAHWEIAKEVREMRDNISPKTLIVGNGDVLSRSQGEKLAKDNNLDGIMIGRGIFQDPYVFSADSKWQTASKQSKINLYKKQVLLFKKTYPKDSRPVHILNKFCKIYINGFDGAKEMREKLMRAKTTDELLAKLGA